MYITNGRVFGGPQAFQYFGYFLDNLSISGQTIDRALTIHTESSIKLGFNEEK